MAKYLLVSMEGNQPDLQNHVLGPILELTPCPVFFISFCIGLLKVSIGLPLFLFMCCLRQVVLWSVDLAAVTCCSETKTTCSMNFKLFSSLCYDGLTVYILFLEKILFFISEFWEFFTSHCN